MFTSHTKTKNSPRKPMGNGWGAEGIPVFKHAKCPRGTMDSNSKELDWQRPRGRLAPRRPTWQRPPSDPSHQNSSTVYVGLPRKAAFEQSAPWPYVHLEAKESELHILQSETGNLRVRFQVPRESCQGDNTNTITEEERKGRDPGRPGAALRVAGGILGGPGGIQIREVHTAGTGPCSSAGRGRRAAELEKSNCG